MITLVSLQCAVVAEITRVPGDKTGASFQLWNPVLIYFDNRFVCRHTGRWYDTPSRPDGRSSMAEEVSRKRASETDQAHAHDRTVFGGQRTGKIQFAQQANVLLVQEIEQAEVQHFPRWTLSWESKQADKLQKNTLSSCSFFENFSPQWPVYVCELTQREKKTTNKTCSLLVVL